ncbi:MAG: HIT family protein [Promethearchaeota archaeon]
MNENDCIFCQIVEKKIPSKILYEDEKNLAFLDIYPIYKGHTIVIPKCHYRNLEELPEIELAETFKVVKKLATLIHNNLKIDGYNVLQNNFEAAGQAIQHFHVHIIPRSKNDGRFKLKIPREQSTEKELNEILNILKERS